MDELNLFSDLVYREAAHIDRRQWDQWLALYADDCEFWVPMWVEQQRLTRDPKVELSHIYIGSKAGLEDRVWRVKSRKSIASVLLPRTTHQISNFRIVRREGSLAECTAVFNVLIYDLRNFRTSLNFGYCDYLLTDTGSSWKIRKKTITLQNDLIDSVVDFYLV